MPVWEELMEKNKVKNFLASVAGITIWNEHVSLSEVIDNAEVEAMPYLFSEIMEKKISEVAIG